jgi:type IV pilus assembly protein PilA
MPSRSTGFTLIELMVALAVLAILVTLALPSVQAPMVRQQIVDSAPLINLAKNAVTQRWTTAQKMPEDNAAAGLPAPEKLVGNHVSSVRVDAGAIHVTFGNQANGAIKGRTLSFRPAVVDDAPVVPVAWVCAKAAVPEKMSAKGADLTDVEPRYLPLNCRPGG